MGFFHNCRTELRPNYQNMKVVSSEKSKAIIAGLISLIIVFGVSISNLSAQEDGEKLFKSYCASCHSPGSNQLVRPALAGVYDRRSPEWVMNMILNPDGMLKEDPIAQIVAKTPEGSSFYIEYNSTDLVLPISEYYNRELASRFAAFWFTGYAVDTVEMVMEKRMHYHTMFGDMLTDDITSYKPEVIFLINNEERLNMIDIYNDYEPFMTALKDYQLKETVESRLFLFGDEPDEQNASVFYDVYVRKKR